MRRSLTIFILAVFMLAFCVNNLNAEEPPYLLVRVDAGPEVKIIPLLELGLDIVDGVKEQYVDVVCHPDDLIRINALGYQTQVLIHDMVRHYQDLSPTDEMGGFRTYSEVVADLNQIHADHPDVTSEVFSIGQSIEGRDLWVIKVSDNPGLEEDEPEIFFNGLTHAREPIGMSICMELLERLTDGYGIDPEITDLVDTREIFFLPVFNPDGYIYNEQIAPGGGGMWRKNRRNNGGSYGVDLNRNWAFNWGYNNIGSSGSPSSETYRGTAPFSEPETEAVRQFCNDHIFSIVINFHSYGDYYLYSWSIPYSPWGFTPDNATFQALSQTMQQWNGYTYGTAWEILYEVNGDANDWQYGEQVEKPKSLAWVPEVGSSFWPSVSSQPGLIAENIEPSLYLIDQAGNYMPTPVSLAYAGGVIDDVAGGNGNGGLDPGESVFFTATLRNNGWETGTGISAMLSTADPYVVITGNSSTYPNLDPQTSAPSNSQYAMNVSSSCPLEHNVHFELDWTCNEGYSGTASFNLMVGDPLFQPMGPDAYGYMAYDNYDEGGPAFNWIEIDPSYGGPGTLINFSQDDETVHLPLPFSFQYYGQTYNEISVCTNGWIAMGATTETDYSNSHIPDADGPAAMIAPFWEDLSPQQVGQVAYYYDAVENYFIVEFDSVRQYLPSSALETFEVILYDPAHYPTITGDGQILFQYNGITDPSQNTVGIENHDETIGLELLYNGSYDSHIPTLEAGVAILFTTPTSQPDMSVALTYLSGSPVPSGGGYVTFDVSLQNNGSSPVNFDLWIEIPPQITPPSVPNRNLTFPAGHSLYRPGMPWPIPASWPAGNYEMIWNVGNLSTSTVWATDSFPFEKSATDDGSGYALWEIEGDPLDQLFENADTGEESIVSDFALLGVYPNPFNPTATLRYGIPEAGFVSLKIFDLLGREVATLTDGYRDTGSHLVSWDASDMASGIYLYVLRAGGNTLGGKMVLMK